MQTGRSERSGMARARMRMAHVWLQVWSMLLPLLTATGGGLSARVAMFFFFFSFLGFFSSIVLMDCGCV